jgi:hypothetical protein
MERSEIHYLAYMLRLRRVDTAAGPTWRVTLDAVDTGEHLSLADPEQLATYLRRVTVSLARPPSREREEEVHKDGPDTIGEAT